MAEGLSPMAGGGYYAGIQLPYGIGTDAKGIVTVGGVSMYATSMNASVEGDLKEYKGPTGQTITLINPAPFYQIQGDGWISGTTGSVGSFVKGALVEIDDEILTTLGVPAGTKFRVESASVQFANEDVAKLSYTFKQYPSIDA